jgi:predicted metal-dependent phosphotriesterase family hydrolase
MTATCATGGNPSVAILSNTAASLAYTESGTNQWWRSPADLEKATSLVRLIEMGYEDQLVLGHDACLRHQLKRFGGMGLDHVSRRIIPLLRDEFGVATSAVDKIFVQNPRRLLTIAAH